MGGGGGLSVGNMAAVKATGAKATDPGGDTCPLPAASDWCGWRTDSTGQRLDGRPEGQVKGEDLGRPGRPWGSRKLLSQGLDPICI